MAIWVSSLARAPHMVAKLRPGRVISLLSPYDDFPTFNTIEEARHLKIALHDIDRDMGGQRAPTHADAERILDFVAAWDLKEPMLVHCLAGISRSTATAFIAACMHAPGVSEEDIAWSIRQASPTAKPNARLVALADAMLGRDGRMIAAANAIGRGVFAEEADPFLASGPHLALTPSRPA
jgi:predicted protein tyrosine phosphatase